ncbi:MAG: short-chain dehydrogenase [Deltaproteobacteria bacterium]|nr:short-chain dehydrogenase [Deltaproteobacteria bacterium]
MAGEFEGRVAIVTGAGGGLGYCHADYLAKRGARVLVNDLGGGTLGLPEQGIEQGVAERAAARIREAGGDAIANHGNVCQAATAQAMVERAVEEWGRGDILINNAGIASAQFFPDIDDEEMQRHVGVTLMGCLNTMRAVWPLMIERKFGRIINTGSAACFGNPIASYASTKAGLWGLTKTVAIFGREHGIHVNLLLPAAFSRLTDGLPESDFKARLRNDFVPEKVSPVVAHLCHERCDVTGEVFSVGGGRFSRVVYAATDAEPIDDGMESVEKVMSDVMARTKLNILSSTHDDMVNLGFPHPD